MTDREAADLARRALTSPGPEEQRSLLMRLEAHRFKSSMAPEREIVLYAAGVLHDRLGDVRAAAMVLRKLERYFPKSDYLPECQLIIAQDDLERRRLKEAEARLRKSLTADLPAESSRRAQELLLWSLVEQNRAGEGLDIVAALRPIGTARPSERGLVAILLVLCHHQKRDEAEGIRTSFRSLYPESLYAPRVELAWGRLLGVLGEAKPAAEVFAGLIKTHPRAAEADEARLALATLLSDGKLPSQEAAAFPTPDQLLAELNRTDRMSDQGRRSLLLRLQLALQRGTWTEALGLVAQYRQTYPKGPEQAAVAESRATAVRSLVQQGLEHKEIPPLLEILDGEAIQCLTPEQRKTLVLRLARMGLPEGAQAVLAAAPAKEQPALRRTILEEGSPAASPDTTLALLPSQGGGPLEALRRAQALAARKDWEGLRKALPGALPGAERIAVVLAYLRRPLEASESPEQRRKESEAWLARLSERGPTRSPLAILVADQRMQAGDWRGALALYPAAPEPPDRAWVMLMRAQALQRLGRIPEARKALESVAGEARFKTEREALAGRLNSP